jgi:hypothetical protein
LAFLLQASLLIQTQDPVSTVGLEDYMHTAASRVTIPLTNLMYSVSALCTVSAHYLATINLTVNSSTRGEGGEREEEQALVQISCLHYFRIFSDHRVFSDVHIVYPAPLRLLAVASDIYTGAAEA